MKPATEQKTTPAGVVFTSGETALFQLMDSAGQALQRECIAIDGINHVKPSFLYKARYDWPPLFTNLRLDDFLIDWLPAALYGYTSRSLPDLIMGWDFICRSLASGATASVRAVMLDTLPKLPVMGRGYEIVHDVVRYLGALRWFGGELSAPMHSRTILVRFDGLTLGFGDEGLLLSDGRVLQPKTKRLPDPRALRLPLGPNTMGSAELTALHDYLARKLPLLQPQMRVIMGTAVAAGKEFQDLLCSYFDVDMSEAHYNPPGRVTYDELRALVTRNEPGALWHLCQHLVPTIGKQKFIELFGNPYRAQKLRLRRHTINRLLSSLSMLENQKVELAERRPAANISDSSEVAELLDLQKQIDRLT